MSIYKATLFLIFTFSNIFRAINIYKATPFLTFTCSYILRVSFQTGLSDSLMVFVFLFTLSPLQWGKFICFYFKKYFTKTRLFPMRSLFQNSSSILSVSLISTPNHPDFALDTIIILHLTCRGSTWFWRKGRSARSGPWGLGCSPPQLRNTNITKQNWSYCSF